MKPPLDKPSIAVTAAGGFIGSTLVRALLANGSTLRVLIAAPSHTTGSLLLGVQIAIGDIPENSLLRDLPAGVGTVVLLAGSAWVEESLAEPHSCMRPHVGCAVPVLEAYRREITGEQLPEEERSADSEMFHLVAHPHARMLRDSTPETDLGHRLQNTLESPACQPAFL
jgi:nucleoside-diphosphate-sugar epimerase